MQIYNAIVLRNLPQCRGEDVDYSFYRGDKVILTIEDDGVMWIDEIGHNPATICEVDEDDVAYFTDNLFELLERRVNNDLQHDLDNVDMYLGDLASVIKVQQNRVKLTRDKLNQITDDEVTAIASHNKAKLDAAFNLTWEYDIKQVAVVFTTLIKDIDLRVAYFFKGNYKTIFSISAYVDIDQGDETEILLIDHHTKSIDEVISYISTFFLRLRESVNYLEVNNADSTIHTIED